MPPASKKDCSVILFDLATKSRDRAIQTLLKICCNNFLIDSKDLTKLILLNSDVTKNRLAASRGNYEHINEVVEDVVLYNPTLLLELIENSGTGKSNWLEGLEVALKNLQEEYQDIRGIITLQLLFITDLAPPFSNHNQKKIDSIVASLNQLEAYFYVVGPAVEAPFPIKSSKDVRLWMKQLAVDQQNQNLQILEEIITKTENSVVCDYKMGTNLFFSFKNWGGTQPWNVPLTIGSKIQIPAQTMKTLNEIVECKLVAAEGRFGQAVWIDAEDESVEIDFSEVKSGIMRHNKFVEMPDNKTFQVQNPRSFSVLCFTDSCNVPEYLMRGGGCYCVLPGDPEKSDAFDVLVDCLAKQNKYIIARRIYNNNFVPKIVAMIPKPDHVPKCFLLTSLPFGEDVRFNYRERSVDAAPKSDVCREVYDFLNGINIDDEKSPKTNFLGVNMIQDVNTQKIVNKAADKLLGRYMNLAEVDVDFMEAATGEAVASLKNIWAERRIAEVKKNEDNDDNSDSDFDW